MTQPKNNVKTEDIDKRDQNQDYHHSIGIVIRFAGLNGYFGG